MIFRQVKIKKSNITSSLDLQPTFDKFGLITRQLALQSSKYIYRLEIYDFQTMDKLSSVDIYQTYNQLKHFIKFVSDYNLVAINTIYEIRFYQIQPLKLVKNILHEQQNIYDLEVSADGELVVLVGQYIKIWRTNGFKQITFPQVITSARYCAFSNDNKYMAITSNFQINIYTFSRVNGGYLFNQITSLTPPVTNGDVTSIQFNPTTSNELIVGFLNVSPQLLELDTGLFKLLKDIQPKSSLNAKKAQYMPDGRRILSSDYINGIGIWPGVNNTLYYKQGYLLYDLRPNKDGTSVIGYVWQQVKFFNIQVECSPQKYMKICPCNANQHWDYYNYNCQPLKCLPSEFATGEIKNNQCVCITGYTFNQALGKCQVDCSIDKKSVTINPNTGYCYCKQNYVWNQNTKSCQFDCTQIPNSSGVQLSSAQCQCNQGFVWNSDHNQCVCPKYMKQVAGQCVCFDQYYPSPQGKCIIDCNTIVNQNGSLPSEQECQCTKGYYFTQYNDLVGCKLNCTNFNDTLQNSPGFTECLCLQNMNWVNNTCKIDCKNVQYASGASTTVANGCNCAVNYLWIDKIHQCGKNCSGVANVNQTLHSTLIACPCINNFNWNQDTQKCVVDCKNVKNTNPYSLADPTKCQCRQAFDWNSIQYKCDINCSKIWGANKEVSDEACSCKKGNFNKQKLTCESSQTSSLFSSPLAIVGFVISIIIFCIIMLVLIRYCWQFSTTNNKEHEKKLKLNDKQPFKPNKKKRLLKNKANAGTEQMLTDERLRTNNAFGTKTTV